MSSDSPDYTLPVSITGITITSLPIDIVAQTIGNLTIDVAAQSMGNLDINIAASAITLDVDVTNLYIYVRTEAAQNLRVDIVAQAVGNLEVDIVAQAVGNLAIDIAAQTLGTVAISIDAQVVDLNIKTSGGTNIVIDKLVQSAYVERRVTVSNNSTASAYAAATGDTRKGKFFPRGMRGFIEWLDAYCKDAGASGGTITVYLAPYPGAGYLWTGTISVAAGGSAAYRYAYPARMWEYDSLFIWWVCSSADIQIAYDTVTNYDARTSSDSGVTWAAESRTYHHRVYLSAVTAGDLPVSGTINTIEIPATATRRSEADVPITVNVETTIIEVYGMGCCEWFRFHAHEEPDSDDTFVGVWVDGAAVYTESLSTMNYDGFGASTPGISLTKYSVDGRCVAVFTVRFEFTRHFRVTATNYLSGGMVSVDAILNLRG